MEANLKDAAPASKPRFTDPDPEETAEWLTALESVIRVAGEERGQYLLRRLDEHACNLGAAPHLEPYSAYRNTITVGRQRAFPGDLELEERLTAIHRWNALAMVARANKAQGELGGHIASYTSGAELFEVGFNHFFRGPESEGGADLVYLQPHSAPGVYARAFLEGRLTEENLSKFRQEVGGNGLCSYPHPWLMPDFWQFPTGSMGIGPINSIYQARFMRYLEDRGLASMGERHVWGVFGDGEMDEPESTAALTLAAREGLDNLTWVINCNLQRLDGPVRGNSQIIPELERVFSGAGWNVIKVLWGSAWDSLFARDTNHALLRNFAATVDGKYQTLGAKDGAYNLDHFFNQDPELRELVAHMSDSDIEALNRGGHDLRKVYAAYAGAREHKGVPTVVLAKTKKGYGMGGAGESRMTAHSTKELDLEALNAFRHRFDLPLSDEDIAELRFLHPGEDSPEVTYLRERRKALGGYLPTRSRTASGLPVPPVRGYAEFALEADQKEMSTTVAAVRMISALLRDKTLGPRIVPIVADEARTFGMANLFRQVGIYSPVGQLYEPEDAEAMLFYKEAKEGQILEEGITEAGALSSWVAAATSDSVHGIAMVPFYIFYSIFGFQRVGDLIWAAADQRARGFLLGATAGRTTLSGEGLQHQDGHSHLIATTVPNCRSYDPAFAFELAVILDHGLRGMLERNEDVFYYVTVYNLNFAQPSLPQEDSVQDAIIKGLYRFDERKPSSPKGQVRLLGSGAIMPEVLEAADILAEDWNVASEVWSATSYCELEREARAVGRWNSRHPEDEPRTSHLQKCFSGSAPIVAASDYVRAYPQLISPYLEAPYVVLGTDGFGRSDERNTLRHFFEVDARNVVVSALNALRCEGTLDAAAVSDALVRYDVDPEDPAPWTC